MRVADGVRYGLWFAVAGTAMRNRREYGVPTAWLTHLLGNTVTLLLPEWLKLVPHVPALSTSAFARPILRTVEHRVCDDPNYAWYAAPLALGFIASHPNYSIYHGAWAERTVLGFGVDSVPHATAAYGLARLVGETLVTLDGEMPAEHELAPLVRWCASYPDALSVAAVGLVTLLWEVSEYQAHHAEMQATGRPAHEVNMQWSWPDAITDSISNLAGLIAAIAVRRTKQRGGVASTLEEPPTSVAERAVGA